MKAPEVVRQNESVRVVARSADELLREGLDEDGKYAGGKWGGLYLRAPDIFFRVLEKAGDKLVRLGDVAEVRFGIKTGRTTSFTSRCFPTVRSALYAGRCTGKPSPRRKSRLTGEGENVLLRTRW